MLPEIQIDITEVIKNHKSPKELVLKIKNQVGDIVFDVSTSKGREDCRSLSAKIIKCISPALEASKALAVEAKAVINQDLSFRKEYEAGIREIADNVRKPLTEWEENEKRKHDEEIAAKKFETDWNDALVENELFDFRKAKAIAEEKARIEAEEKARLEYEQKIRKEAIENEKKRAIEAQRQAELLLEKQKRDAELALKKAEADKIEAARQAELAQQKAVEAERQRLEKIRLDAERSKALEASRIEALSKDKEHRRKINTGIVDDLAKIGISKEIAVEIIKACIKGDIKNLTVNY